jgi:quinol monooxygenase YgiN
MHLHLLAAIGGAVIAASGTGVLAARCFRAPSVLVVAWTGALLGLAVALAAQTVGYGIGYNQITFRAMELGAQVVAPLALALGLSELAAKKLPARFAMRLVLGAVALLAIVILGTDPLSPASFSKSWPAPSTFYQIIPNKLLEDLLAPLAIVIAVASVMVTAARPGRDPAWRKAFPPAAVAGLAAVLLALPGLEPALATHLGITIPLTTAFTPICGAAAALAWYAAWRAEQLRLDVLRSEAGGDEADSWDSRRAWDGADHTGDFEALSLDSSQQEAGYRRRYADAHYANDDVGYPPASRYRERPGRGTGYPDGGYRDAAGGAARGGDAARGAGRGADAARASARRSAAYDDRDAAAEPDWEPASLDAERTMRGDQFAWRPEAPVDDDPLAHDGAYDDPDRAAAGQRARQAYDDPDRAAAGQRARQAYDDPDRPASRQGTRRAQADPDRAAGAQRARQGYADPDLLAGEESAARRDRAASGHPFGQIAIYTLLEDRVREFDRLTKEVVRRVRTEEPDTLVYIFHAVPAAPMQRILYEVYRDRAAYEDHKRRSYVARFEADRRPYVLATNVIELGLKQAKVSPQSSISDLLSDTGFDLLSDTGFGQPGYGPRAPR